MTLFVPLDPDTPLPTTPAFLNPVVDPATEVNKVVKAILKAKRIALVCGAGISVQAGIPDFRSSNGLFQSIKRDNQREALSSGKDLFDASVFSSEHTTALFCQMIAQLATLSDKAGPTSFHKLLRRLDDKGKLLRVYTQNIDALEAKAGLTFGLPAHDGGRTKARTKSAKAKGKEVAHPVEALGQLSLSSDGPSTTIKRPVSSSTWSYATTEVGPSSGPSSLTPPSASQSLPAPRSVTPRCIPLHGTLQTMHCQACTHSFPLSEHLPSLLAGSPPDCPECTALEATRSLVGKRPRGVGKLRPSVVLYNEEHKDGEGVGEVAGRDLIGGRGRGADLLIVVGTSLRVPGTKRIVREFSKAVKSRAEAARESARERAEEKASASTMRVQLPTPSSTPTSTPSPRRSPAVDDPPPATISSIYINLDFPVPTREWDGVFDVWIQGDAQRFAEAVREEMEKEERDKAELDERKKRREEERAEKAERVERERVERERVEKEKLERERLEREAVHEAKKYKKSKAKVPKQRVEVVVPSLSTRDESGRSPSKGKSRSKEKKLHLKNKFSPPSPLKASSKRPAPHDAPHEKVTPSRKRRVKLVMTNSTHSHGRPEDRDAVGDSSMSGNDSTPSTPTDSDASSYAQTMFVDLVLNSPGERLRNKPRRGSAAEEGGSSLPTHSQSRHRRHHLHSENPSPPPNDISYSESATDLPVYHDPLEALLPMQIPTSRARYEPYRVPSPPLDYDRNAGSALGIHHARPRDRDRRERTSAHRYERERRSAREAVADDYARSCEDGCACRHARRNVNEREMNVTPGNYYREHTYADGESNVTSSGTPYRWKAHRPREVRHGVQYEQSGIQYDGYHNKDTDDNYDSAHIFSHSHNIDTSRSYSSGSRVHRTYAAQGPLTPVSPRDSTFDDEDYDVDIMTVDDDNSYSSSIPKSPRLATPVRSRRRERQEEHPLGPSHSSYCNETTMTPNAPRAERVRRERSRSASPSKVTKVYQSSYARMRDASGSMSALTLESAMMHGPDPNRGLDSSRPGSDHHGSYTRHYVDSDYPSNEIVRANPVLPSIHVRRPSYDGGDNISVQDYDAISPIDYDSFDTHVRVDEYRARSKIGKGRGKYAGVSSSVAAVSGR